MPLLGKINIFGKSPINLVFCPNIITFARKFQNTYFKNGKQELQAHDGDVGAALC